MICSQDFIRDLSDRIERAYGRRYPRWNPIGITPGVWESAASRLSEASKDGSDIPIDPELFVAVQPKSRIAPDPWSELTQAGALQRYIKALRRIIRQLRAELETEVRRAECRLRAGASLDEIFASEGRKISPLTRFILAHRAGRADLSSEQREAAQDQHRSCPLYRLAADSFLPSHAYPTPEWLAEFHPRELITFSRN